MSVPVLTHRRDLRKGDLVFPEEILPIGDMLDAQLDCVSKEVQQEVFGPELDTSSLCDWLNLHTAYDFALQDVVDHIEITLCRNFGEEEHPFTYPLNRAERDVLRGEMKACCQLRTGRTLTQQYNLLLADTGGSRAAGAHGRDTPAAHGGGWLRGGSVRVRWVAPVLYAGDL